MANDATIGALRLLLIADSATFEKGLEGADAATKKLAKTMRQDLEPSQAKINRLIRDFEGTQAKGTAEAYAKAIQSVGGATKLTAQHQEQANSAIQKALAHYKALGQTAPPHLLEIEKATRKIEAPTNSVGSSLEMVGSKMKALAGLFGVGFGAAAFVSFAKGAVDAAGSIVDLSAKTGLSTEAVQLYGAVARQTGGDLNTYADAIFKAGINIAEGSKATKKAISDLGLDFAAIRAMKPEDQFEVIAEKLKGITNDGERNRLGVLLYGKTWKDVAAGVVQGIGDIKAATDIAGDAQVRAVDAASDAFDRFLENSKNKTIAFLGGVVLAVEHAQKRLEKGQGPPVPAGMGGAGINLVANWLGGQQDAQNAAEAERFAKTPLTNDASGLLDDFEVGLGRVRSIAPAVTAATKELTDAQKKYNEEIQRGADILTGKAMAEQVKKLADEVKRAGGESKITAPELKKLRDELDNLWQAGAKLPPVLDKIRLSGFVDFTGESKVVKELRSFTDELERLKKVGSQSTLVDFLPEHLMPDWMREIQRMRDNPMTPEDPFVKFTPLEFMSDSARAFENMFKPKLAKATESGLRAGMRVAFDELPDTVLRAFQGGGDVWKSVGAMFGASIAQSLVANMSESMKTSRIGQMLEDVLPGLGAIGGGLIGKGLDFVADKFFGGQARRVNDVRDAFIEANGGAEDMLHTIASLGNDPRLIAAWERINSAGSDDAFKSATTAYQKRLKEIQTALGQTASKLDGLAAASEKFGGVLPKSLQGAAQQLLGMTGLTGDLRRQLESLMGQPSWETRKERAEALGINLDELGGGFNQERVKAEALALVRTLQMFEDAGDNMDAVLRGAADEVVNLIVQARKTGAQLPKTLETFIKRLSEMGLLLDENGTAIDMGALSFADFEDEALIAMRDLLTEIKDILAKAFPAAAEAAGRAFSDLARQVGAARPRQPVAGTPEVSGFGNLPDLPGLQSVAPSLTTVGSTFAGSAGATASGTYNIYAIDAPSFETFLRRGGADAVARTLPDATARYVGKR